MSTSFTKRLRVVTAYFLLVSTQGCGGAPSADSCDLGMGRQGIVLRQPEDETPHQPCRTAPNISPTHEGAGCKIRWVLESRIWEPRPVIFADLFGKDVQWTRDTLWISDISRRRISEFRLTEGRWSRVTQIQLNPEEFRADGDYEFAVTDDKLIVGSYDYGPGEFVHPGRLLIHRRHNETWTTESVTALQGDALYGFGGSVALALRFLATNHVTLKTPSYVFEQSDRGWRLVFTTPRQFDHRRPLALQPDLLTIGGSGDLYIFARYAGVWHEQRLTPPAEYDEFARHYFLAGPHLWTFSRVVKLEQPGRLVKSLHADRYAWRCNTFEHEQSANIESSAPGAIVSDPLDLHWPWLAVAVEDEDWQTTEVEQWGYRDAKPPHYQHRKVAIFTGSEHGFRQVAELEPEIPDEVFAPFLQPAVSVDAIAVGAQHVAVTMRVGEPFNPNLEGLRSHGVVFIYRRVCSAGDSNGDA